jgi:serine/threonine protein kinase
VIAYPDDASSHVARLYSDAADVAFQTVLEGLPGVDEDEDLLADLIDADGRARLNRGLDISLHRYLDAVPDLTTMPIALDAAIEFALRGLATGAAQNGGRCGPEALGALIEQFPALEAPIRTASMLSEALFSTNQMRRNESEDLDLPLPSDYGPIMPDGRSRYELRTRIGRGGHGAVFLAADRHLSDEGRPAYTAIKILTRGADRAHTASVREEAARARRVDHANVVRVLDRGTDDNGRGYIVYEFVDGPSLRDWLAQRGSPPTHRQSALLVTQIAHGVQAAHAAGVVHCDLKPDNILMARLPHEVPRRLRDAACDVSPKVADFGIAVCLESARSAAHRNLAMTPGRGAAAWGTLGFVSPEQYRKDDGALSPPADVYALGGLLYFLLTGRIPNGQSPKEVKRHLQRIDGEIEQDRRGLRFDPRTDPDLEAICRRALAMKVQDRYASAEALAGDLEAWVRREPLRWIRPTPVRRLWLLTVRQPRLTALLLFTVLFVSGTASLTVWWRMESAYRLKLIQADSETELARTRIAAAKKLEEETHAWYAYIQNLNRTTRESIANSRGGSLTENWLSTLTIIESLLGKGPLLPDDVGWWPERITVAGELVDQARAGGVEPPIVPLFWESALGFWMLNDGDPVDARRVLARNRASWSLRTTPGDPWLGCLELLETCAAAREIVIRVSRTNADTNGAKVGVQIAEDSEFLQAIRTLEREDVVFAGTMEGTAAHRTVLRTLQEFYAPGFLNDAGRRRHYQNRLRSYLP